MTKPAKPKRPHEWIKLPMAGRTIEVCGACNQAKGREGDKRECRGPVRVGKVQA